MVDRRSLWADRRHAFRDQLVTYVLVLTNFCVDHGSVNIVETSVVLPAPPSLDEARRAFERDYLAGILRMTQGNVTHAARLARRNRTEFYRLLDRHSLSPGMFKASPRGSPAIAGASTEPAVPV